MLGSTKDILLEGEVVVMTGSGSLVPLYIRNHTGQDRIALAVSTKDCRKLALHMASGNLLLNIICKAKYYSNLFMGRLCSIIPPV